MEFLLTPLQLDIPNSRLRYYLLAKMAPLDFPTSTTSPADGHIWRHIPGRDDSDWVDPRDSSSPSPISSASLSSVVAPLRQFLDQDGAAIHEIPERVLSKWGRLFDIVLPSSTRTCCFTRGKFYMSISTRASLTTARCVRLHTASGTRRFYPTNKQALGRKLYFFGLSALNTSSYHPYESDYDRLR